MKRLLILLLMLGCIACSAKKKPPSSDREYMDAGDYYFKKEFFDEARKHYTKVKTDFPNTPLQAEASLKIADTYYEEGSYKTASDAYEEFIRTFPGKAEVPEALFRLGMSNVKQMPSVPSRDSRATEKVVEAFIRLIVDYPGNIHVPEAQKWADKADTILAKKILSIAHFYKRTKKYKAAALRYAELTRKYPSSQQARENWKSHVYVLRKSGEGVAAQVLEREYRARYKKDQ